VRVTDAAGLSDVSDDVPVSILEEDAPMGQRPTADFTYTPTAAPAARSRATASRQRSRASR
jgi:hypothetical protein